jgi:molybdopterin/thiamine biosynthesis adenylyltransferase
MDELNAFLLKNAQGDLLPWQAQVQAMTQFGLSCRQVEEGALNLNILPARYSRNRKTISTDEQRKLFNCTVAVIGCGGLGGYIIEELARLGVGTIKVIDPDVFEEHNLNRQILCTIEQLGKAKVDAARSRVSAVNPAVLVKPVQDAFSAANGADLLKDVHAVADALDSVPTRMVLAEVCETLGLPLIHGTIGGWYGQITTQMPGDRSIQNIYGACQNYEGMEKTLGNPAFTPAVVASLEVAELCKVLLGHGTTLQKRLLFIDLLDMTFHEIAI